MRKILLIIIVILLFALGFNVAKNGIGLGNFTILSIGQVEQESQTLKRKIEEANSAIDTNYPKRLSDLEVASRNYDEAEVEYLKYTNLSTDEQIIEAKTEKSYTIEFLWTRLGVHAGEEGVNITFEPISSSVGANNTNDIKFTVNGSYIAITNFVYSIENDTTLDFQIENFKLLPYKGEILQATFTVPNVTIEGNTLADIATTSSDESTSTSNSTTTNTNNTNTDTANTNTVNTNNSTSATDDANTNKTNVVKHNI